MTAFHNLYAQYYDLLYKDKNYEEEAAYIDDLIKKYSSISTNSILELGCGTGKHAQLLVNKGYSIVGVDSSTYMIEQAKANMSEKELDHSKLRFVISDIRELSIEEQFDAVLSLFHVMSYQTSNNDIERAFSTAASHLKENGIFIFDIWYGPAVLNEKLETRVKRLENDKLKVTRIAQSNLYVNKNIVDVNYEIIIQQNEKVETVQELHQMRYFFIPELEKLLQEQGLRLERAFIFLAEQEPTISSWNVCVMARKEG